MRNISFFLIACSFVVTSYCYYLKTISHIEKPVPTLKQDHEYQLIQLGNFRSDQYLIDKKTGRVWNLICTENTEHGQCIGELIWGEMRIKSYNPR